jgi:hypothetical protein
MHKVLWYITYEWHAFFSNETGRLN